MRGFSATAAIDEERQARTAQQHDDFFGATSADVPEVAAKAPQPTRTAASLDYTIWVANGSGGYRAVRPGSQRSGPVVRETGGLGVLSNILGLLNGRIRTDNPSLLV